MATALRPVPRARRRSILGHMLASLYTQSLKVYSTVGRLGRYALPVGGLACLSVGAFTLATWAGWGMTGVSLLLLDAHVYPDDRA